MKTAVRGRRPRRDDRRSRQVPWRGGIRQGDRPM